MTASTPTSSSVAQVGNKALAFPARVIQKVIGDRLSGHLTFTDPRDPSIGWNLYVGNGQLHYANSTVGHQERFNYLCQRYCPQLSTTLATDETEYQYLCRLWQQGQLTLPQLRKLLFLFSQEALVHIFAMPQATLQMEQVAGLEHLVLCVPIKETLSQLRQAITQAVQVRTYLNSPLQRLVLTTTERVPADLWPMD